MTDGNEREIISGDTENADIIIQVCPVPAPRRATTPGEPAAAGEGPGEGEEVEGGAAGVGRAPCATAQTAEYRQEFSEVHQQQQTQECWDCDECSFQTDHENCLLKHIKSEHMITCFTCRESFSKIIEHRRIDHPLNKICSKFPNCERGDTCLYKHEGSMDDIHPTDANQTQGEAVKVKCKTGKKEFKAKNEMMVHRKINHINVVMCKSILSGVNCRKGAVYCWYRHTQNNASVTQISNVTAPAFNVQNFPYGPIPQRPVVGQDNMPL